MCDHHHHHGCDHNDDEDEPSGFNLFLKINTEGYAK